MARIKDFKLIMLFLVLIMFSLMYFFTVNKVSYAFDPVYNLEKNHENKLKTIELCAMKYGENNQKLFDAEDTIYIKVKDLIESNLIATNNNGEVKDILNNKSLNDSIVKIKLTDGTYGVEVNS